ncbi:MAG: hypothetical protein NVSMB12_10600 [Acidimicrobiales bacterium]
MLARRRLTDAGWEVRLATSADEALSMLDGVDLVLLDYRLPGMSGIDALREIRRRKGPSVVMVTGMGSEGLAVEAIRAGAIDYITKDGTYLEDLPHDVERAWRHHDVQRRAAKLERLAMLVTATSDRDRQETLDAIVEGARDVLRADACTLQVMRDDGLRTEARAGEPGLAAADLRDAARSALGRRDGEPLAVPVILSDSADLEEGDLATDRLLVPIRSADGHGLGVLALLTTAPVAYHADEIGLARTFAAFAGIALANLHRLELEQQLVAELQHVLDTRRDFLAHVSHELRTPLTCIEGFAHTLLTHGEVLGDDERTLFLTKIGDHGRSLHQLVESLLDFAAVEAGRTPVSPTSLDLRAEVSSILEGLAPLLSGRQIETAVGPATVWADPALLRRAVTNLITNAVKYSDPAGPIIVRAEIITGGAVRVDVVDSGPGITEDELSHVFDPFWRGSAFLHGTNRGTGLGLSLVREYARLLGGEVGATSAEGGGSRFWITLPIA